MYKNIMVAVDGSKLSARAVVHALGLAGRLDARLVVFFASPEMPLPIYAEGVMYEPMTKKEYAVVAAKEARKVLDPVVAKAKSAGVEALPVHSIGGTPWEAILAAAKKEKCDAIVMASHGRRGLSAVILGSETQKVLTHSKVPVLVVR
jgi:nucleotide-binding universal stress UspA family protein